MKKEKSYNMPKIYFSPVQLKTRPKEAKDLFCEEPPVLPVTALTWGTESGKPREEASYQPQ